MIATSLAFAEPAPTYLAEISPRDSKWNVKHRQTLSVASLYESADFPQYATRMRFCAPDLCFALKVDEDSGLTSLKLHSAQFCRVRFCPTCTWRRSLMWTARFKRALPQVLQDYPKLRFLLLTLTVRNCPPEELRQTITHMNESWRRMTQRKAWPALGYIKAVEVTRSHDDQAHPHIHAILAVRPSYFTRDYLSHAKWVELWQQCLRIDYTPIVNIKPVKPKPGNDISSYTGLIMGAIVECVKYTIKDIDLADSRPKSSLTNSEWLSALANQMHNTRTISVGGILKDYLSEEEPEDLIHSEDETEATSADDQATFGWRETLTNYVLKEILLKSIPGINREPLEENSE